MPRSFLAERRPPAPAPLVSWLEAVPLASGGPVVALLEAGLSELDAARSAAGRVRAAAFHLLAADAFVTYACEVALEADEPRAALVDILQRTAVSRP